MPAPSAPTASSTARPTRVRPPAVSRTSRGLEPPSSGGGTNVRRRASGGGRGPMTSLLRSGRRRNRGVVARRRQPFRVAQRAAQQELDLRVQTAQVRVGPPLQRLVQRWVDAY